MTCGPVMQISPVSPCASTLDGFSISVISTTVPGAGKPSEPGRDSPVEGLHSATGDVSLRP